MDRSVTRKHILEVMAEVVGEIPNPMVRWHLRAAVKEALKKETQHNETPRKDRHYL
jgi:hypothetical protein